MRALITGGAGFIGSHLAEALLERGNGVLIVDDLSTGSVENIQHLKRFGSSNGGTTTGVGALSAVTSAGGKFQYVIDTVMNVPVLAELVD